MTDSVVVEGYARLRDGKKWKTRWLVLRKPSPVAGAGVFLLASAESEQISFLFDCIVRGISPTRGPFGLRPVLPDLSPNQTNSEEKLNHEAQELEKRLSMLSHRISSAGGDDRSISGSSDTSDTSQSDCSVGSRLVIWSDPASNPSENTVQLGAKVPPPAAEKLSVNQGVGTRPTTKAPRQLQEIGRQSSSDSGIATGSHSSYSGSFSSYTGSLDITPAEEFGSVFSLPPHLAQDLSPCSCPAIPGHEYQVPTSLRYLYDSPRSLLQEGGVSAKDSDPPTPMTDTPDPATPPAEAVKGDKSSTSASEGHSDAAHRHSVTEHSEDARKTKMAPSSDSQHPESCHICSSLTSASKTIVTICSVCGGYKVNLAPGPHVAASERPRGDVTYVNIPVSPTSKKQLNYMELELQEPGPGPRGPSSTKYAQIDITATETAHKVGTQHALGRQEGLHTLELRRKATPH
uniref:Docking protein 7 n=1 Tax=Sphaeramia orbicularis TaxID=375764 RepID=A0A673CRF5_9TELE